MFAAGIDTPPCCQVNNNNPGSCRKGSRIHEKAEPPAAVQNSALLVPERFLQTHIWEGRKGSSSSSSPSASQDPDFTNESSEDREGRSTWPRTQSPVEAEPGLEAGHLLPSSDLPLSIWARGFWEAPFNPMVIPWPVGATVMRRLARTCLPNTFAALPKGKPPVISDGCPWQQLKQIHQSKEKGKKGQSGELVFAPGGNLGVLNLSACQAQIPSLSCLAQFYRACVFLRGKVLEGRGSRTVPRALEKLSRCLISTSPPL